MTTTDNGAAAASPSAPQPDPANPATGGSYQRDPVTGALQPLQQPGEAAHRLHRAAQADDPQTDTPAQEA